MHPYRTSSPTPTWRRLALLVATVASLGLSCGDKNECSAASQKSWLRTWTDDLYLWYREVPASDPAAYATPQDYFKVLRTPAKTTSGKDKDQFHFFESTAAWRSLAQSGVSVGYGMQLLFRASSPPRDLIVAYNEPDSPAAAQNVDRGAQVLAVDGAQVLDGDAATLNAGLWPKRAGESHAFTIQDVGAASPRTVTLVAQEVTSTPVRSKVLTTPLGGKIGYLLMNDHLATAEGGFASAIASLKAEGVTDLVLDLRYNGGGYLAVASAAAHMISGKSGEFERIVFNDKYPGRDPIGGGPVAMPIIDTRNFSTPRNGPLPTLGLARAFVITGPGTCSASEALMNGLAGVDVPIVQFGATTCGKPYGFYPADKCGTTYFSIQFKGVNAKLFGDYADGFSPRASPAAGTAEFPGCAVADDLQHPLGDPAEARLAAALGWIDAPGTCPAVPAAQAARAFSQAADEGAWQLLRSPAREAGILVAP